MRPVFIFCLFRQRWLLGTHEPVFSCHCTNANTYTPAAHTQVCVQVDHVKALCMRKKERGALVSVYRVRTEIRCVCVGMCAWVQGDLVLCMFFIGVHEGGGINNRVYFCVMGKSHALWVQIHSGTQCGCPTRVSSTPVENKGLIQFGTKTHTQLHVT